MDVFKGYPLRKIKLIDQLLMWGFSPIVLQFVLIQVAAIVLFNSGGMGMTAAEADTFIIQATSLGSVVSLPLLFFIIVKRKIPLINRRGIGKIFPGLAKAEWKFLLWYIPVSMYLFGVGGNIVQMLFGEGEMVNQQGIESMTGIVPVWLLFLMIVVAAPIAEEWLFRGMIMFRNPTNEITWTATIVSSIIFGLVHVPTDIPSAYTYMGMGLMFGFAAKKTGSVEAAIFFHFINNVIGFAALFIGS